MRSIQKVIGLLLVIGVSVAAGHGLSRLSEQATSGVAGKPSPASGDALPKDIYPDTGNRFPPVKREELDEYGKQVYDRTTPEPTGGPRQIRMYSLPVADDTNNLHDYLRIKSGFDPRLQELAILVTAREMDCQYVWTQHEAAALKLGLDQKIIDTIKYRKPLTALGEKDAVVIQLGRESIGKHKVDSNTFSRALTLFGNQGVVNVLSVMGDYGAIAILLAASDQHVRPGQKSLLPIP